MAGLATFRAALRYATSLAGLVLAVPVRWPSSPGVLNAQQTPPSDPATQRSVRRVLSRADHARRLLSFRQRR